jgi:transcriptional regulator of NAD metabolism
VYGGIQILLEIADRIKAERVMANLNASHPLEGQHSGASEEVVKVVAGQEELHIKTEEGGHAQDLPPLLPLCVKDMACQVYR